MKGFVPTPTDTVDLMVAKLFDGVAVRRELRVLDPGCGDGEFVAGVVRYCEKHRLPLPHVTGVELDRGRAATAKRRFAGISEIHIRQADFLSPSHERFDLIIGNPPYVSILGLDVGERAAYRNAYSTARGRFDLYVLDQRGRIVPRHSVYYVVPSDPNDLAPLATFLNSTEATDWLRAHCQRAAKGFFRMQSHVLKQLPLPSSFEPRLGALATSMSERHAVSA